MDIIIQHKDHQPNVSFLYLTAKMYLMSGNGELEEPNDKVNVSGEIKARINRSKWIVECSCASAIIIDLSFPYFMCCECGNLENEGKWLRIVLPEDREEIEAVLLKRTHGANFSLHHPDFGANRNWSPGETLLSLKKENFDHGLEV